MLSYAIRAKQPYLWEEIFSPLFDRLQKEGRRRQNKSKETAVKNFD